MTNKLLILGSLIYDSISTPLGERSRILGGSANYAALAMSFYYDEIVVVGSVGRDYLKSDMQKLTERGIDISHIYTLGEETPHWEGRYEHNLNQVITLNEAHFIKTFSEHCTDLALSIQQDARLSSQYQFVFLANIDPHLQFKTLEQLRKPLFVAYDTKDSWIRQKHHKDKILEVLRTVDILFVNEQEAQMLTQAQNAVDAAYELKKLGPKVVIVKRGEYGFLLCYQDKLLILPAFPLRRVVDTTGAGDVFAGGFIGFLLQEHFQKKTEIAVDIPSRLLAEACLHGNILASYVVEDFGMTCLENVKPMQIQERLKQYKDVISFQSF